MVNGRWGGKPTGAIGATIRKPAALQWALAKLLGEQEQIAVRVLDQEFMPATLTITVAPPNYARLLVKRSSLQLKGVDQRIDVINQYLKVYPATVRVLHFVRFPSSVTLAHHDLCTFRTLQVSKTAFCSLVGDLKAKAPAPEIHAAPYVRHHQLRHNTRKTISWGTTVGHIHSLAALNNIGVKDDGFSVIAFGWSISEMGSAAADRLCAPLQSLKGLSEFLRTDGP
jgi:hypothetical protein